MGFVLQSANYVQSKPLKVDGRLLLHGMWVLRSANPCKRTKVRSTPLKFFKKFFKNTEELRNTIFIHCISN